MWTRVGSIDHQSHFSTLFTSTHKTKKASLGHYKANFNVIAPAKENREKRGTGRNGPHESLLIDGRGKHGQGPCSKKEVIESPPPF